jgi:hypothetical protein
MTTTKKIFNLAEKRTHRTLQEICEKNGAQVFPKMRVADVLKIEQSGISDREYRYALQAHFDFVIADASAQPLFAVEFDGPLHDAPDQAARDRLKNGLCERLGFPLLRVKDVHLTKRFRSLDLLSWFVEVWFYQRDFEEAQAAGTIAPYEFADPFLVIAIPESEEEFPFWLSKKLRIEIQRLFREGSCVDRAPQFWIGMDSDRTRHGIMWLRITADSGVMVRSGMRAQHFPVSVTELLEEIMVFLLFEGLEAVLQGESPATPLSEIEAAPRRPPKLLRLWPPQTPPPDAA